MFESFFLLVSVSLMWIYRVKKNRYFHKVLLFWCSGTLLSFMLGKFLAICRMPEFTVVKGVLGVAIAAVFVWDLILTLKCSQEDANDKLDGIPKNLFRERKYDMERVCYFIQKVPIVGMDAPWGDGKSFLVNMIYQEEKMQKKFVFIQIDLLTCDLNEIENILLEEIERVLQSNGLYSFHGRKEGRLFKNFSLSNIFYNVLREDEKEVSSTFVGFEKDVQRLDKDILIVFEDIDRIRDKDVVRNIFAISEKIAGRKIHILFQYELHNLPWDKEFLEKYIPYEVYLTELSFERIVSELWEKCGLKKITNLKIEDVKYIMIFGTSNVVLNEIEELKKLSIRLQARRVSIRRVELYLKELYLIWEMNERFQNGDSVKWLAKILFIKHFLYEQMELIKMGESLAESLLLHYKDDILNVETLIGRYHANIYTKDECIQIVEDPVNNEVIWIFGFLQYNLSILEENSRENPRWFANESDSVLRRKQHNEMVDHFLWNIKGNGNSEYTDMEWNAKELCEKVLSQPMECRQKAWENVWEIAFQGKNEKNNETVQLVGETAMLSAFKSLYVTGTSTENWIRMIEFYFTQKEAQCITVDMIENLNFVSLTNKDVLLAVARGVVQCKVVGNMNEQKAFASFLKRYLNAIWGLGYARGCVWRIEGMTSDDLLRDKKFVLEVLGECKSEILNGVQSALFPGIKQEFQLLKCFLEKCEEIVGQENALQARSIHVEMGEPRTVYEHDDLLKYLEEKVSNLDMQNDEEQQKFMQEFEELYRQGKLNPEEYRIIAEMLKKKD